MNDDEIRDFCIKKDFQIFKLEQQLQQKDNIIKEVREYIEHENYKRNILVGVSTKKYTRDILNRILDITYKE
jgi:hypothetical protein